MGEQNSRGRSRIQSCCLFKVTFNFVLLFTCVILSVLHCFSPYYKVVCGESSSQTLEGAARSYKSMKRQHDGKRYRTTAIRNTKKTNEMLMKRMAKKEARRSIRGAGSSPASSVTTASSSCSSSSPPSYESDEESIDLLHSSPVEPAFDCDLMCRRVRMPRDDDTYLSGNVCVGNE